MKKFSLVALTVYGAFVTAEDSHYERVAKALKQTESAERKQAAEQCLQQLNNDMRELALNHTREFRNKISAYDAQQVAGGVLQLCVNILEVLPDLQDDTNPEKQARAHSILNSNLQSLVILTAPYKDALAKLETDEDVAQRAEDGKKVLKAMIAFVTGLLKEQQEILNS